MLIIDPRRVAQTGDRRLDPQPGAFQVHSQSSVPKSKIGRLDGSAGTDAGTVHQEIERRPPRHDDLDRVRPIVGAGDVKVLSDRLVAILNERRGRPRQEVVLDVRYEHAIGSRSQGARNP